MFTSSGARGKKDCLFRKLGQWVWTITRENTEYVDSSDSFELLRIRLCHGHILGHSGSITTDGLAWLAQLRI